MLLSINNVLCNLTISQYVIYIIFSFKKFIDRNGQKHDPIQEIPKIRTKQFS